VFKLDGLPPSWSYIMTPERLVIPAKGVGDAQVTIQPHSSSPVCTREEITINAYTPRVDTLKQLGGITLNVGLKNPLEVTGNSRLQCNRLDDKYQKQLTHAPSVTGATACAIITEGCTDPGIPNAQVAVVYTAPDGSKQVRYVTTDANGCYVDVLPVAGAGLWQTQVVVEETDCREEAKTPKTPIVVGPVFPCSGPWWCCVLYVVFIIAVVILVLRLLMLLTGASYERMKATLLGALAATLLLAFLLIRYCHVDICWILLAIVIAIVLALMILFYRKRLSKQ
jgi:hypothetical protein